MDEKQSESKPNDLTQAGEPQTIELEEQDLDRVTGGTWTWTKGGITTGG